ncbi:hypothetical protein [Ottowia sp.]|uniref:hypothetical protein n=1 Tax=Ottowia sp. TaxID=1898956 RepID=UPI003A8BBA65
MDEADLCVLHQPMRAFGERWNARQSLVDQMGRFVGDGRADEVSQLDYVIYEGLQEVFTDDFHGWVSLGAAVLGQSLVKLLHMRWCWVHVGGQRVLGLHSDDNDLRVPLQAMVVHRLSAIPQFETFEHLFFDIYTSAPYWPDGCHPLVDAAVQIDDFEGHYGHLVPEELVTEIMHLDYCDPRWIRSLGMDGYTMFIDKDWENLRAHLHNECAQYSAAFGRDWKHRVRSEYMEELAGRAIGYRPS